MFKRIARKIDPYDSWLWTWPIWTFGAAWLIVMIIVL